MHATKQPYISAKLFRKRLLQYCWKGKKEKASVNERMNAEYHYTSKTKITVTEERTWSLIIGCSVIQGTLSGYFVLKAQIPPDSGSALRMQSSLYHQSQPFLQKTALEKNPDVFRWLLPFSAWLVAKDKSHLLVIFTSKFHTTWFELQLRTSRVFF